MIKWAKVIALFFLVVSIIVLPVKFKDVPINHWAYDAVMYVSNLGIISGYPDGTFRGMDYVSRYQLAVAVYRTIEYMRKNISGIPAESASNSGVSPTDIMKLRQDIEEKIKKLENNFEQYKSYVEGKIDNITQKLIQLSVDLADSANKYTELKGGLTNIELKILTQDATIEKLYELYSTEEKKLREVDMNVEKLEEYMKAIDNKLEDLNESMLKNNYKITSKMKALEDKCKNLEKLSVNVENLGTTVATNVNMISDLQIKVLKNEGNISKVEEELSKVKSELSKLNMSLSNKMLAIDEKLSKTENDLIVLEKSVQQISKKSESFASEKNLIELKDKVEKQQAQLNTQKWLIILSLLGLVGLGVYVVFFGGGS